jgi:Second Messenger Oligonucleotide or Dinucleotide Synthetase domain
MGLADWFSTFCDNIVIRDGGTIASRYQLITKRLNTDFWNTDSYTSHSLYVGSYGRNTAISPFSDLDMVFELPSSLYTQYDSYSGNGQSALLQAVRTSLQKTYPSTKIKGDGQVVLISFTDGIDFEVVPVFRRSDDSYTFANSNDGGSWKTTNPRPEIEAIKTRNTSCNGNLIRLARMLRAWKIKWNVPIGGLLIDTLAYQFIENWQYRDKSFLYYDFMLRDFFHWASSQNKDQEWWRAPGSGQYVYGKGLFQNKAKDCYNLAVEAISHETATPKREWSAKQRWRDIFGSSFPD